MSKEGTLRDMSSKVKDNIQRLGKTTLADVVNIILSDIGQNANERSIKKRIGDIVNVLVASGIVTRDNGNLTWNGSLVSDAAPTVETQQKLNKINEKEENLRYRLRLLALNTALVNRNMHNPTTNCTIHLPFILVNAPKETYFEKGKSFLKISIPQDYQNKVKLLTPLDIMSNIEFNFDIYEQLAITIPETSSVISYFDQIDD